MEVYDRLVARNYEIHVTSDGSHYKQVHDYDDHGVGSSVARKCANGRWRMYGEATPYPTEMVESGPGGGPKHCPVCEGDAISEMHV
jgi:hypothetical protein